MNRFLLTTVVAVLLLGSAVRFHRLEVQSFWNDEGNSARLSERPIPLILEGTASDIHPPLYYLLLHGWRALLGESEFSLRAFSAFVGVVIIALIFALGRAMAQQSLVAMVAALLAAVNPALVYYSQETRMYALLACLATVATLLLVRWLSVVGQQQEGIPTHQGRIMAVVYVLCATAGLYTHYFFPAVLLAHNFIVVFWLFTSYYSQRRFLFGRWIAMMAATFLLYLPWLPIFLQQAGGRPTMRASLVEFLLDSGRWLAFGATVEPAAVYWPWLAVMLLLLGGAISGGRRSMPAIVACLTPVLFMFAVGTTQPEFFKFMLVAVPPFCLLLAFWGASSYDKIKAVESRKAVIRAHLRSSRVNFRRSQWWRPLALLLSLVALYGSGLSLQTLYTNPFYARADYRGIVTRIAAEAHPNAGIILDAPNQWEVFTYYHRQGAPVYPLPRGRPDHDDIAAELNEIAARHDRLYAIFWGEGQRDPERLVEHWLDEHAFKARDEWVGDVRFVTYAVPSKPATVMKTSLNLRFGEAITLKGYTLDTAEVAPGDIVQLTLFWQTTEVLRQRYKVFLHLVDGQGQLMTQRDSEPGGGLILTTTWRPGEVIIDNQGIFMPADTPAGEYTLLLGLYDLSDPAARLPLLAGEGIADAFPLATITVGG